MGGDSDERPDHHIRIATIRMSCIIHMHNAEHKAAKAAAAAPHDHQRGFPRPSRLRITNDRLNAAV